MQLGIFIVIIALLLDICGTSRVTKLLLPKDYDYMVPPKLNGKAVNVSVSLFILNLRAVREKDLSFTVDLFLHQEWVDYRLNVLNGSDREVVLHSSWKSRLWLPDTYFKNGIKGDVSSDLFPTSYFRISNRTVFMAARVSVELVCEMNFAKYPHDVHECNITLMSLSHNKEVVELHWNNFNLSSRLFNSDYTVYQKSINKCDKLYKIGTFSCISSTVVLKRNLGHFVTRKYIPSSIIVITSFIGFCIPTSSYPARVSVVVTSLLALITQELQITYNLSASYVVAISVWMNICTTLVFLSLIEFAFAILWEEKQRKEPKDQPTSRISKFLKAMAKDNSNPVDNLAKYIFPLIFLICIFVYTLYVILW